VSLTGLPELPELEHRIIVGDEVPAGAISFGDLPDGKPPLTGVDPGAPALLLYTSGATARLKGGTAPTR
jgi:acyl-coenzyme A synthetase/AMP-(fatty) acid ligase